MATGGLYGTSTANSVVATSGAESTGLYGNATQFGGSYFEWFIFQVSDTQPATPTGGSWSFTTNSGTPPAGWSSNPPTAPTNTVWVSIAIVNSKNATSLTWSVPGKFSFSSGLPILSGSGSPLPGDGQSDQLYIQLNTTPQTIWFKESGTWTRLTGSSLYADLTSNQTIAGIKTFSSPIVGSVTGTAANVTGIVAVLNGGTGVTTSTGTGSVVLNTSPLLNTPILSGATVDSTAPYLNFTPTAAPTYLEGRLFYDSTAKTLTYYNDNSQMSLNIGQENVVRVRNQTGATITEGSVVYVNGATGNTPTVSLAIATSFSTADIIGVATTTMANNEFGYATTSGLVNGLDTSAFSEGQAVFVSATTPGAFTATEPVAPNYSVQVGVILRSNPSVGTLLVSLQMISTEVSHLVGTVLISQGGTGQTTANAAFNALAPSQTGNTGKYLTTDGSNTSWATNPLGTVTSVAATVPGFLSISGSPITTSGTLAIDYSGTALPVLNGGTGTTTSTGTGSVVLSASPTLTGTVNVAGLTASNSVTLSGGTANGVTYLNGSKVLTSGSALTFDGTNLGFGGNLNSTLTSEFYIQSPAGTNFIGINQTSGYVRVAAGGAIVLNLSNTAATFNLGSSEQMRLNSTGLGIGTSSPAYKLDVVGSSRIGASGASTALLIGSDAATTGGLIFADATRFISGSVANNPYLFYTNNSEKMRLDSSGNLGLGVTPSAWSSGGNLQFPLGALSSSAALGTALNLNAYYNAGWKYQFSNTLALLYQQGGGGHAWLNAPSGTAGNPITFTQAMTLDASGNLGIGTTSPLSKLNAKGTQGNWRIDPDSVASEIQLFSTTVLNDGFRDFRIRTQQTIFDTAGAERMRLDSSGELTTTNGRFNLITVGRGAGAVATNTAVGASALAANTTGARLTAIGYGALQNTTVSWNTAVGYNALNLTTTGNTNSALGVSALEANTTGSSNSSFGYQSLYSNTTASNNTAVGYQAGYSNTTGAFGVFLGRQAGYGNTTASNNVAVGESALYTNSTGTNNIAIGQAALYTNTGSSNTAIGHNALVFNTTASNNTAVGYQAGYSTTVGGNSSYFGYQSGYANIDGIYNVGIGRAALAQATNSNNNVAIGYFALGGITTTATSLNTAVGYGSGSAITTGSKNTILGGYDGNQGGLDIRTASNYIVLSDGDGNPQIYNSGITTFFGLGGTAITYTGTVELKGSNASNRGSFVRMTSNGSGGGYIGIRRAIQGGATGTEDFIYVCNDPSFGVYLNGTTATSWSSASDERLKENLVEITDAVSKVSTLRAVIGNYKADADKTRKAFLIAQDVQAVLPEAVGSGRNSKEDETEYLSVAYTEVIPLLVAAIKEQQALIATLQADVAALKAAA